MGPISALWHRAMLQVQLLHSPHQTTTTSKATSPSALHSRLEDSSVASVIFMSVLKGLVVSNAVLMLMGFWGQWWRCLSHSLRWWHERGVATQIWLIEVRNAAYWMELHMQRIIWSKMSPGLRLRNFGEAQQNVNNSTSVISLLICYVFLVNGVAVLALGI